MKECAGALSRAKRLYLPYSQSESETESEEEEKERVLRCNYLQQTKKEFKKNPLMSGYEGETALSAEASTLENRRETPGKISQAGVSPGCQNTALNSTDENSENRPGCRNVKDRMKESRGAEDARGDHDRWSTG
ncbi:hypothetical protein KQX54_008351 [Cotesia glomerata]|uniref:Uncharacterized protein n=1 Tax=Cotesia glomerata TaxID=32391 RepID=A0AAV7J544_COTGL|nr:hypothetical protein KQX54_008351 [Cotesia glomerata]